MVALERGEGGRTGRRESTCLAWWLFAALINQDSDMGVINIYLSFTAK